ncbi:MAG: hypothetical protein VB049_10100 [Candidatus Pelethousia sp.]|nr:hypothetical protein [Candidatus Pelethousia sp.]
MNRTIGFYPFFIAAIMIIVILAISFLNMYLLARHKRNPFILWIHGISLLTVGSLIFHMVGSAVFVLPLSAFYDTLWRMLLLLAGIGALGGVATVLLRGQTQRFTNWNHSIPEALKSLTDTVFVADQNGVITYINCSEKYQALFGSIGTMDGLASFLQNYCAQPLTIPENLAETITYLLYLEYAKAHMVLQVSPIFIAGNRLGYTVVLHNISAIKDSEKELDAQNKALRRANAKLSEYIRAVGALEAEKERLQIFAQVQETLIRDMERVLLSIRAIKQQRFKNGMYQAAMKELAVQLRAIYQKVRSSVGRISGKETNL